VIGSGCATTPTAVIRPAPFPGAAGRAATPASAAIRQGLVETALAFKGIAYRLGGSDPGGFDCSGLVRYVFTQYRIAMPRTVAEQAGVGHRIDLRQAGPGDLVFFAIGDRSPTHVGIVIDRDTFIHAPGTGQVVRAERFTTPYWTSHFAGARRVELAP
jgi:cell wall-associated NlpC family hydrolase